MATQVTDPQSWTDVLSAITSSVAVTVAVVVAIVESLRARKARKERDSLELAQRLTERREAASRVSGWVERSFVASSDGSHYEERAIAHLANDGNQAVFQVHAAVILTPFFRGTQEPLSLGPLSIPEHIPVLPAGRELTFDVSLALRSHRKDEEGRSPDIPELEILFIDSNGTRWSREADGQLAEADMSPVPMVSEIGDDAVDRHLGRFDPWNPLAIAVVFLNAIRDDSASNATALQNLREVLAPEAPGWDDLGPSDIDSMREQIGEYNLGGHIRYPARNIAYVRLYHPSVSDIEAPPAAVVTAPIVLLTMTFTDDRGWRVFSYGGNGTAPDRILFPEGTLADPRVE